MRMIDMKEGIVFRLNLDSTTNNRLPTMSNDQILEFREAREGEFLFSIFYDPKEDLVYIILSTMTSEPPNGAELVGYIKADCLSDAYDKMMWA